LGKRSPRTQRAPSATPKRSSPAFDAKDVAALADLMTDDVRLQIGNAEVVNGKLRVHHTRLDGTELTLPCCNVFRLRDGAVTDYRVYMDITPVYR
jgi:ketosteroid isomerase-like protein